MSFTLDQWKQDIEPNGRLFAGFLRQEPGIGVKNSVTAALLWSIRREERHHLLTHALPDDDQRERILDVLADWVDYTPQVAAKTLSRKASKNDALQAALNDLITFFVDDLLKIGMLQPSQRTDVSISGDVSGTGINIAGQQYVAGSIINNTIKPKAQRLCPKPPAPPAQFGGRDAALNTLTAKLKSGETVAITAVSGLGGVGKTTLAKMLAHQLHADNTFRAVLWADVTRTPDVVSILSDWVVTHADSSFDVTAMQNPRQIAAAAKTLLEDVINEQCERCEPPRVLVVLDDVWDNGLETARLITEHACPAGATVLMTSRSGKLAIDLKADNAPLDKMTPDDAAAMLAEYLPSADTTTLRELGAALGGHALALELAARYVQIVAGDPGETEATALTHAVELYQSGVRAGTAFDQLNLAEGEAREDNLEVALSYSYDDLDADDQARFRALGVLAFDEPFDTALLAALWDADTADATQHARTLRTRSLLDASADGYRQHPLLRAYARALLERAAETDTAFARYADYVIDFADQFWELPLENWGVLEPTLPHVHYVGDALTDTLPTDDDAGLARCIGFAYNVKKYVHRRKQAVQTEHGTRLRGLNWLEMGLAVARQTKQTKRESLFLSDIGLLYDALGEKRKALDYYNQALPLWREVGDKAGEATTLNNIGSAWRDLGDVRKALDFLDQALPLMREVGDKAGEATTLSNIGEAWRALGEVRKALDFLNQALPIQREVGDRAGEAVTLSNIGLIWRALGEVRKALDYYNQALPLMREVGDKAGEATTLNNLGYIYFQNGELERTVAIQEQIIPIMQQIGDIASEALYRSNIAVVLERLGRVNEAVTHVEQAIALLKSKNLPQTAGGGTIADLEADLARLRGKL